MVASTSTVADTLTVTSGRPRVEAVAFAAGAVSLALSGLIARSGAVSDPERAVFRVINELPGWLYPIMWPLQQAGNLAAGAVVAAIAALCHRRRLALAALVVTLIDVESYVKHLVPRERPGTTIPSAILRGDVPVHGQSFPSGHAILITSLAVVVTPYLRGRWRLVPWIVVGGVVVARIYVGAHNPLDLVAGVSLGLMIGVVALVATHPVSPVVGDPT
jgi:undecaprenyl-diphosphatase